MTFARRGDNGIRVGGAEVDFQPALEAIEHETRRRRAGIHNEGARGTLTDEEVGAATPGHVSETAQSQPQPSTHAAGTYLLMHTTHA